MPRIVPVVLLLTLILGYQCAGASGSTRFDKETAANLTDLIQTALLYDIYDQRCRGFVSSMHTDNVENLSVDKLGMSLSQLSETLVSKSLLELRQEMNQLVLARIRQHGGCLATKRKGYLNQLDQRYQRLYGWLSD